VEVWSARTEYSQTFATPHGTFVVEERFSTVLDYRFLDRCRGV
jgi:hypothetical protein